MYIFLNMFLFCSPVVSERNELLIQFLSDLSLTADGFIGHYKFRPKKLPTTTAAPVTTTNPVTTSKFSSLEDCVKFRSVKRILAGRVHTDIPVLEN